MVALMNSSDSSRSLTAAPRWATRPSDRPHRLGEALAIADVLGWELMPWQETVLRVGTEVDPETGLPAFREIDLLVPRQAGKSTIDLLFALDRAVRWGSPQNVAYTAQTGQDARMKLVEDHLPLLERSPLRVAIAKSLKGAAMTYIKFTTGSRIDAVATAQDSGHGRTYGLAIIDEAMADSDNRREGALVPTMNTIADAQILVSSTAGTEQSQYLRRKVDAGRALVDAGQTSGIAYFEWSAADDDDPDDPATWWSCHPALGHTINEATIRHARQSLSDGEFRRAYLNQWVSGKEETVIPFDLWERACDPSVAVDPPRAFAVSTTLERDWTTVAVSDGLRVEVADHRSGVGWAGDWLVERAVKWRAPVAVDKAGPAGSLIPVLERAGVDVVEVGATEVARAAVGFHDRVVDGTVRVRQEGVLDAALANARKRPISSSWGFGRRTQDVPITPLEAVALAVWAAGDDAAPQLRVIDLSSL